jgi:hypothetical protein
MSRIAEGKPHVTHIIGTSGGIRSGEPVQRDQTHKLVSERDLAPNHHVALHRDRSIVLLVIQGIDYFEADHPGSDRGQDEQEFFDCKASPTRLGQ